MDAQQNSDSAKETLLQKIDEVDKEHASITAKLAALKSSPTPPDWAAFVTDVTAASTNLKSAVTLLKKYKPQTATEENVGDESTDDTLTEYEKLYNKIKTALVSGDIINEKVDNNNFESLIFTPEFKKQYPDSQSSQSSPINTFIMAIKTYSSNANAKELKTGIQIQTGEEDNLNHELLKAVLDALAPADVKNYLSRYTPTSLNDLLEKLTQYLSKTGEINSLTSKITELFNVIKSQGGGGSSSSYSKKNRKSHKSYHPGIGKTRKHHSHSEPKRVSFVHQA